MTSGIATPAGNYRTENIILHSQWHAHMPVLTQTLEEEHGKQAHQVPIHQADAVFYMSLCTCEGPNFRIQGKEKISHFQKNQEDQYQLCQT